MIKKLSAMLAALCLLFPLASCDKGPEAYQSSNILYFDTVITLTAYMDSQEAFDALAEDVFSQFEHYHKLYDIYHSYSGMNNLATVNKNAGVSPVEVHEDILDLLEFCIEVYDITDGMTNVAMGSVLSLWHDAREDADTDISTMVLPTYDTLLVASEHTSIESIVIDREASTVYITDPEVQIDVGSIAKGFAAERIKDYLIDIGVSNAIINAGGNICATGTRYNGDAWRVGIQNPGVVENEEYIHLIGMSDGTLVTSGAYRRYFVLDGIRYHHIINPNTLYPEQLYESVSVICDDSALGDALSTALFSLTLEEGQALIAGLDGVEVSWCTTDGEITTTAGFSNYIIEE